MWKLACKRIYIGIYCARTLSLSLILSLFLSIFSRALSLSFGQSVFWSLWSEKSSGFFLQVKVGQENIVCKRSWFRMYFIYLYIHVHLCTFHLHVCTYNYYMFVHICVFIYIHIHTYIHTHTCWALSAIEIGFGNALTIERILHWPPHIYMYTYK